MFSAVTILTCGLIVIYTNIRAYSVAVLFKTPIEYYTLCVDEKYNAFHHHMGM